MSGALGELVGRLRAARAEGAAEAVLVEALHAAVRGRLSAALRREGLAQADADDVAQQKVERVAGLVGDGGVESGREEAFVDACGVNAARDFHRANRRRRDRHADPRALETLAVHPFAEHEERGHRERLLGLIRELVRDPGMPDAYRAIVEAVYFDGTPIEALVEAEMARAPRDRKGRPRTPHQARETIDQRLSRARDWIRTRACDRLAKEDS